MILTVTVTCDHILISPHLLEPGSCTGLVQTSVRGGETPEPPGAWLRSGAEPLVPEDLVMASASFRNTLHRITVLTWAGCRCKRATLALRSKKDEPGLLGTGSKL